MFPKRVPLKRPADESVVPMHVLQHAVDVIRRRHAQIFLIARVPRLRQIGHAELAVEQVQFQAETHDHMQVVGDLVGVRANQRALNLVDGPIELIQRRRRPVAIGKVVWSSG